MRRTLRTAASLICTVVLAAPVVHPGVAAGSGIASEPVSRFAAADTVVPGTWVVGLDGPMDAADRANLLALGVDVERVSRDRERVVVSAEAPLPGMGTKLGRLKGVEWAEPLRMIGAALTPNDPIYPMQWGLDHRGVNANAAWDLTLGSPSVVIAILDSGIDLTHPEFAGRVTAGWDFVNRDSVAQDDNGHGTHVAGVAAAAANNGVSGAGVAPGCSIMPVKVLDSAGLGSNFDIGEGIRWAADRGADVINLSIDSATYSDSIGKAVAYAHSADAVVVAAAGNRSTNLGYPAALPGVVGVSALDPSLGLASFSNRGEKVDLAAPGVDIQSAARGGGSGTMGGTSMASPFVAGAAALVRSRNPLLNHAEVASMLVASATDLGPAGHDRSYGSGLLHVARAVALATAANDDEIPGVRAPASPVAGAAGAPGDARDVFAVTLLAGETIAATLTAGGATDFDLSLYGPHTRRVAGADAPLASSAGASYPKVVTRTVSETGVFYLDVAATSGSGDYMLEWRRIPSESADDEIPGVELPPSPFSGSLARGSDNDDVYRIRLDPGYRLAATLTASSGTDFELLLYPHTATTVNYPTVEIARSGSGYPSTLTYTAKVPGTYYLDAYAWSGSGAYTVTWSVTKTIPEPDDDVPGAALGPSPVSGTLSADHDRDDVYWVDLDHTQELTATLSAAAGTDYDLHLYGPGSSHVAPPDTPLVSSESSGSSEIVKITAPSAGRYYLNVRAFAGSGPYSIVWSRGRGPADDDIPGVALTGPSLTRLLGVAGDADDVFAIPLAAGQQLDATLRLPEGADFDLYLYGPSAVSIASADTVAASYWKPGDERIVYVAPVSGTYYLDARRWSGSGVYSLDTTVGPAVVSASAASLSATQPVGTRDVGLNATLTAGPASNPVGGVLVAFEAYADGAWRFAAFAQTAADGSALATSTVPGARSFRVRHSGDGGTGAVTSAVATVPGRASPAVTLTASKTKPAYRETVTLTARARDASSSAPLGGGVWIERRSGASWVRVASSSTTTGVARAMVRLGSAATYRAVFGGTETQHPAQSTSVVVKPKVSLGSPSVPSRARADGAFAAYGSLKPRHTSGTKPVQIRSYRLEGDRWVLKKTYSAKVKDYSSYSRYYATVRLPSRGTWRLRAYAPVDADHTATLGPASRWISVR